MCERELNHLCFVFPHHSNELLRSVVFSAALCSSLCLLIYFSYLLLFVSPSPSLPSYMVMPFVAQDLGHIMKRKRLTDRIITYLFYQLLRGLKVSVYVFIYLIVILQDVLYGKHINLL